MGVAPRGLTQALCERPPSRDRPVGGHDWVPSLGGHTRCVRRTSLGRFHRKTGSDKCKGRDQVPQWQRCVLGRGQQHCVLGRGQRAGLGVYPLLAVRLCLSELPFCFIPRQPQCSPCLVSLRGRVSNHEVARARRRAEPPARRCANRGGPRPVLLSAWQASPFCFWLLGKSSRLSISRAPLSWRGVSLLALSSSEPRRLPQAGWPWAQRHSSRKPVTLLLSIMAFSRNQN